MSIICVGISHKTAKLNIREKFHFSPRFVAHALNDCREKTDSAEVLILSTCNRVELYSDSMHAQKLIDWLHAYHEVVDQYDQWFYCYEGVGALKHALRVASSLDSQVMGEPQILGQFKEAHRLAVREGCIGCHLSEVFNHVISTTKKIRHHTQIGHCPVSVAYAALQMCDQTHLKNATVLILGAGETARRMISHMSDAGIQNLFILNRTLEHAQKLAKELGGKAGTLAQIPDFIGRANVIIGALHTEKPLILSDHFAHNSHSQLCIDVSVPRSIEPSVVERDHVSLISIDDIEPYIAKNTAFRARAADEAELMIARAVEEFVAKRNARCAVPTITAMREHTEVMIESELKHSLAAIQNGDPPDAVLEAFAHKLKQKWLHSPSKALHSAAKEGNHDLLELAHRLFDITEH